MLVIVGRGDVTPGPHGTAAAALRLKNAVCVPGGTVLATISTICSKQLGVTVDLKSHIPATEREESEREEREGEREKREKK